jgi:pimeloyl-ACP methyl ester carboxylesterase
MEKWIGDILLDVSPPERAKFKSPLILVHGLWTSGRCWRSWATHFSNLGWECWSVNFRGRYEKNALEVLNPLTFQDCLDDLKEVIRASEFPPVLLAHDLGGLMAQQAAAQVETSALALLASLPPREAMPELPRALRLLRLKYSPLLFLGRPFRLDDKDFRKNWLNALPPGEHAEPLRCLVADSTHLVREFFERRALLDPAPVRPPALVVAAGEDRVAPALSLRQLADRIGADFHEYAGHGHWIMGGENGGEEIVRDIHRWILKKTGEGILLAEFAERE